MPGQCRCDRPVAHETSAIIPSMFPPKMIREFVITEVMLDAVSGDVSGIVTVDEWSGVVESVDCKRFDFYDDATDQATSLDRSQRRLAQQIVRRTLSADSELSDSRELYLASAAPFTLPNGTAPATSGSQRVLADYLEHIRHREAASDSTADTGSSIPFRRLG